jgi:hypothetical protein
MSLNINKVKSTGGSRQKPLEPAGYPGRVVMIVDLGLQAQKEFKGNKKDPQHEMSITYELSDEFMLDEDGKEQKDKPRWQSETFTLRNAKAEKAISTLRYKVLDPENKDDGDFTKQLGKAVTVNIVQAPGKGANAGKIYNNVSSITPIRAKDLDKVPPLVGTPTLFLLDTPDLEVFNSLPEFIQTKIKGNLNYNGSTLQALLGGKPVPKEEAANDEEVEEDDVQEVEAVAEGEW